MSRWKHRFKVTVFDENSFSEIRVFRGTPRGWAWMVGGVLVLVVGLTYLTLAQTQLREWVVPGYVATQTREDMAATRALADSLTVMLEHNGQVVQALRHALAGDNRAIEFLQGSGASAWGTSTKAFPDVDTALLAAGPNETQLRSQVLAEDRFALQRRSERGGAASTGFRYPPVAGTLSDELDLGIGHLGVDLAAAEGSPIQAVDDGTVLFSTYTVETGYTLVLQHRGERVSIYKHCASLLKTQGDLVAGGEAVGLVGNTGEWTSGPHLHFEWWVQGRAVDPRPWLGIQP
jgi:murein DD-endopeptidase MepM/ murein hydrolase activator NlpD